MDDLERIDLASDDEVCFDLSIKFEEVDLDNVTPFEMSYKYFNKEWAEAQVQLEYILKKEAPINEPPELVKDRLTLIRRASTMYLEYISVTNRIIKCYEHIAQPQKRILLRKLSDACIGRVLELKLDLAALENSEFQFLDHILLRLKMQPSDMDIKIPEYFRERTEEEIERKQLVQRHLDTIAEAESQKYIVTEKMKFVRSAMVYIRLLQAHERTRQARKVFQEQQKRCIVKELNKRREARKEAQISKTRQGAAVIIQRAWRLCMLIKSLNKERVGEMSFLRMLPQPSNISMEDLLKDRLDIIKRNKEDYETAKNFIKTEMMTYRVPKMMEDLEDKIRSYFHSYFTLFGNYPEFPTEEEGGSTKMFETSVDLDAEEAKEGTEGGDTKSESQKDTKSQTSKDSKSSKDTKSKGEKDKGEEKPEGYTLKPSKCVEDLIQLQEEYKSVWSGKEITNFDRFDYTMLKEDVRKEVELQIRLTVDEKMRLELEKLTAAFQKDSKKKAKKKKGK